MNMLYDDAFSIISLTMFGNFFPDTFIFSKRPFQRIEYCFNRPSRSIANVRLKFSKILLLLQYDYFSWMATNETVLGSFGLDKTIYGNYKKKKEKKWYEELRQESMQIYELRCYKI